MLRGIPKGCASFLFQIHITGICIFFFHTTKKIMSFVLVYSKI